MRNVPENIYSCTWCGTSSHLKGDQPEADSEQINYCSMAPLEAGRMMYKGLIHAELSAEYNKITVLTAGCCGPICPGDGRLIVQGL